MGDFISRVHKLIQRILNHFNDISKSLKAPIQQPFPRFNLLLAILTTVLNNFPIDKICSEPLEIVQIKESGISGLNNLTRLENKFLQESLVRSELGTKVYKKVANMIT